MSVLLLFPICYVGMQTVHRSDRLCHLAAGSKQRSMKQRSLFFFFCFCFWFFGAAAEGGVEKVTRGCFGSFFLRSGVGGLAGYLTFDMASVWGAHGRGGGGVEEVCPQPARMLVGGAAPSELEGETLVSGFPFFLRWY